MGTTAVGRDGQSARDIEDDWNEVSAVLQRKLRAGTYEFTSYREVLISKGARALPRVVSVPTARDRIALKVLAGVVKELFPAATTRMAQVRVSQLVAAMGSTSYDSFVRVDVRNFYPSVSHNAIRAQLRKKIRQPRLIALLTRAISTPTVAPTATRPNYSDIRGVPQGLSVSNLLAEIAMSDIDAAFEKRIDLSYFRYVDDVLILCDERNTALIYNEIEARCALVGLEIHELGPGSKSQIGTFADTFDYLGYRFGPSGISVREASVRKVEATLARLFTSYKYQRAADLSPGWAAKAERALLRRIDLVIAGCVFEDVPRGWIHYFSQLNELSLLGRLDAYVAAMASRFDLPNTFGPKTFLRAYWHVVRPNTATRKYIPNFGNFATVDKRAFLADLFPQERIDRLSEGDVVKRFSSEARQLVSMLERDISGVS